MLFTAGKTPLLLSAARNSAARLSFPSTDLRLPDRSQARTVPPVDRASKRYFMSSVTMASFSPIPRKSSWKAISPRAVRVDAPERQPLVIIAATTANTSMSETRHGFRCMRRMPKSEIHALIAELAPHTTWPHGGGLPTPKVTRKVNGRARFAGGRPLPIRRQSRAPGRSLDCERRRSVRCR